MATIKTPEQIKAELVEQNKKNQEIVNSTNASEDIVSPINNTSQITQPILEADNTTSANEKRISNRVSQIMSGYPTSNKTTEDINAQTKANVSTQTNPNAVLQNEYIKSSRSENIYANTPEDTIKKANELAKMMQEKNMTFAEALKNSIPEPKPDEKQEDTLKRRRKVATLLDSFRLLSDIGSASGGGNVWERQNTNYAAIDAQKQKLRDEFVKKQDDYIKALAAAKGADIDNLYDLANKYAGILDKPIGTENSVNRNIYEQEKEKTEAANKLEQAKFGLEYAKFRERQKESKKYSIYYPSQGVSITLDPTDQKDRQALTQAYYTIAKDPSKKNQIVDIAANSIPELKEAIRNAGTADNLLGVLNKASDKEAVSTFMYNVVSNLSQDNYDATDILFRNSLNQSQYDLISQETQQPLNAWGGNMFTTPKKEFRFVPKGSASQQYILTQQTQPVQGTGFAPQIFNP